MRECNRHPSQSGGGVCARCLQERLTWLWRGETFPLENPAESSQEGEGVLPQLGDDAPDPPHPLGGGSLASVRTQEQINEAAKPDGVLPDPRNGDGEGAKPNPKDVIDEWAEFHARRRRKHSERSKLDDSSPKAQQQFSRSLDSSEFKPLVDKLMDTESSSSTAPPRGLPIRRTSVLMSAEKIRSRSMPLDNRSAEETALRVIREQADHLYSDELDFLDTVNGDLQSKKLPEQQRRLWLTGKSPKWVKLLVSPMTTSRNKVFPSRGRGSKKRLTRFASSDWSYTDENGATKSPHWMGPSSLRAKEEISGHYRKDVDTGLQRRTTLRSSVFSWLQVLILTTLMCFHL